MAVADEMRDRILEKGGISKSHGEFKKKWNRLMIGLFLVFFLALTVWYLLQPREPDWSVSGEGILSYGKRGGINYDEKDLGGTGDKLVKVSYESRGATVYGILRIPKKEGKVPAIVLLPGAGITKEAEQRVATVLSGMGYATLTIDQRGIGESKEKVGDLSNNYEVFRHGSEPPVHKMVYDALRAYDLLKERPEIDSEKIIFMGESMGGRIAIIASAIEPGVKGVVGMSTGGYGLGGVIPKNNQTLFQKSIDPDAYIGMLAPRKTVMIHSGKDNVVSVETAERTFSFAKEPKRFVAVSCKTHGYCDEMWEGLKKALEWIIYNLE